MRKSRLDFNVRIPTLTLVFDRKHKSNAKNAAPVELRVTYCGKQKYLSTGVSVLPSEWDNTNGEVKRRPDAVQLNEIIFTKKSELLQVVMELHKENALDLSRLGDVLKNKSSHDSFLDFVEQRIRERTAKSGTKRRWTSWLHQMRTWGGIRAFSDINEKNIYAMNDWCHERDLKQTTISTYNKTLKEFINDAVKLGYIHDNPYQRSGIVIERGDPGVDKFLTDDEVERLANVKLPTESLTRVRDMFLFQCLTGLAYADMENWHKDWVEKDSEGTFIYTNRRVKNVKPFVFVLLPKALKILEQYGGTPPTMSNAQYNMRLKIVADAAGIKKRISSHWGRHTAAMVWLNNGIPLEVVSRCLGHSSTNITQKVYAHFEQNTIKNAFKKLKLSDWME
jgi:integrase/recombinase XerD